MSHTRAGHKPPPVVARNANARSSRVGVIEGMDGWLKKLMYGLMPGLCIMCGAYSHRNIDLCIGCEKDLPRTGSTCYRCGSDVPYINQTMPRTQQTCLRCLSNPPIWAHLFAAFTYEPPVDRLVSMFKTEGRLSHGKVLSELLAQDWLLTEPTLPDMFLPVPLHKSRLRQRGFNQALEIAHVLSDHSGIPCESRLCRRIRDTPAQKQLPRSARLANMSNAFQVDDLPDLPHVAIVDDVVTTGATTSALARHLIRAGARRVDVIAIALRRRQ